MPRAGLDAATVTAAAAALVDEVGTGGLSTGLLAERLGVRPPSLYKHVGGLADLAHRIAVLAATELGDALEAAVRGRSGRDALSAAAWTVRRYVTEHPGRYASTVGARPTGPGDPLAAALDRALAPLAAALHGYRLAPEQEVHALRALRSALHGFATLEASDGFQLGTGTDDSFTWLVEALDAALRASAAPA